MPNKSSDAVFQLVKSLQKGEKRNFKLYIHRNSSSQALKTVTLFDALDRMESYDESQLLLKAQSIQKQQLPNLKAQLYREILASLRLLADAGNTDLQLQEHLAHARILYHKGLYLQSLQLLEKMKGIASAHHQLAYLQQALMMEKQIEALHITRSLEDRAQRLAAEADAVQQQLSLVNRYSNLALQLYSWYIHNGLARNARDEALLRAYFTAQQPANPAPDDSFYVRLYYFQSYCWYAFIRQDFLLYYRYTQKWTNLFYTCPEMQAVETIHFIKGLHNLLNALFSLRHYTKFNDVLAQFERFADTELVLRNPNNLVQSFIYLSTARINRHFNEGTFREGLLLVPGIEAELKRHALHLDEHRMLVSYYKFASLYFGSGDNERAIGYLGKIINQKITLRTDLHCYARLLHLIAHYELGNYELMNYLIKSVYRFMARMENISGVEELILQFLRRIPRMETKLVKQSFADLLAALQQLEGNRFETRAFAYLDIISWLESKLEGIPVDEVIRKKYQRSVDAGR